MTQKTVIFDATDNIWIGEPPAMPCEPLSPDQLHALDVRDWNARREAEPKPWPLVLPIFALVCLLGVVLLWGVLG